MSENSNSSLSNVCMYGIKNCDTIKKAKKWLAAESIEAEFHDYRQQGITVDWLKQVLEQHDWEVVLNKRGTTYRQLSDEIKASLNEEVAIEQMVANPAMIKRPILAVGEKFHVGFSDASYKEIFNG